MGRLSRITYPDSKTAILAWNDPNKPVNTLSRAALEELEEAIQEATQRKVEVFVIASEKPGMFLAGADLREFVASLNHSSKEIEDLSRRGQRLFRELSRVPFVTMAAIDGVCLGGGTELSLFCDYRFASSTDETSIGLPEVKIGLHPGWGGCVRAPRLIGLANAVSMITSGEPYDWKKAHAVGLIDDAAPRAQLVDAAVRFGKEMYAAGSHLTRRKQLAAGVNYSETEKTFLGATASAMILGETKGNYPAPIAALELLLDTSGDTEDAALEREAVSMSRLFGSPVNRALLNVFFLTSRSTPDAVPGATKSVAKVVRAGVIGAGIMGSGIVAANIKRGLLTTMTDAAPEAVTKSEANILEEAAYDREIKSSTPAKLKTMASRLRTASGINGLSDCDLVVEAIVENLDAKRALLQQLESIVHEDAVLATNTSTIPIVKLAQNLKRPERFLGIHFFNPVRRMKLVEVIHGPSTSEETVQRGVAYAKQIGKTPVVVSDGPGFLVNRLLFPYLNASLELLSEGIPMKAIERSATKFGMPMGPLALYDMVGLDTSLYAGKVMWEAFPDRVIALPLLPAMVKSGRLGRKNGLGFFSYKNKKGRAEDDPSFASFLETYIKEKRPLSEAEITNRLFMPMLLEATRALEEGIVAQPREVDLGLILGLGFPPYRGGLLFWADREGLPKIVETLKPMSEKDPRLAPTPLLAELAAKGESFYESHRFASGKSPVSSK